MSTFKFQQQTGYTGQTGNALQQSPLSNAFQAAGMLSEAIDERAQRLRNANRVAETTRVLNDIETATAGIWEEFSVKRSIDHKTAQERLQKQFAKIDASIQDKQVRDRVSANMKGEQDRFSLKLDTQEWKFTVNRGISELDKFMLNGGNNFIKAQDETESLKILSSVKQRYYEAVGAGYIDPDKADSQWEQWRGNLWYQKLEEDVSIDPVIAEERFNAGFYDIDPEEMDRARIAITGEIRRKENELISNGYQMIAASQVSGMDGVVNSFADKVSPEGLLELQNFAKQKKRQETAYQDMLKERELRLKEEQERIPNQLKILELAQKAGKGEISLEEVQAAIKADLLTGIGANSFLNNSEEYRNAIEQQQETIAKELERLKLTRKAGDGNFSKADAEKAVTDELFTGIGANSLEATSNDARVRNQLENTKDQIKSSQYAYDLRDEAGLTTVEEANMMFRMGAFTVSERRAAVVRIEARLEKQKKENEELEKISDAVAGPGPYNPNNEYVKKKADIDMKPIIEKQGETPYPSFVKSVIDIANKYNTASPSLVELISRGNFADPNSQGTAEGTATHLQALTTAVDVYKGLDPRVRQQLSGETVQNIIPIINMMETGKENNIKALASSVNDRLKQPFFSTKAKEGYASSEEFRVAVMKAVDNKTEKFAQVYPISKDRFINNPSWNVNDAINSSVKDTFAYEGDGDISGSWFWSGERTTVPISPSKVYNMTTSQLREKLTGDIKKAYPNLADRTLSLFEDPFLSDPRNTKTPYFYVNYWEDGYWQPFKVDGIPMLWSPE